jgi:hypothetical protein
MHYKPLHKLHILGLIERFARPAEAHLHFLVDELAYFVRDQRGLTVFSAVRAFSHFHLVSFERAPHGCIKW